MGSQRAARNPRQLLLNKSRNSSLKKFFQIPKLKRYIFVGFFNRVCLTRMKKTKAFPRRPMPKQSGRKFSNAYEFT